MNEKLFSELSRRLRAQDIAVSQREDGFLPVAVDGRTALRIAPSGSILLAPNAMEDPQVSRVYDAVAKTVSQVMEYTAAMATAPKLEAEGLEGDFRLLAEFNGVILAGHEMAHGWGYQFVTWRQDGTGAGVAHGNYYLDGYAEAKLDFACRSGLVDEYRQFSDQQLAEVYRCVHETLDSGYPMTRERTETLTMVLAQISRSVDGLEGCVLNGVPAKAPFSFCGERRGKETQWEMPEGRFPWSGLCPDESNRLELEAADGASPEWEMLP